MTEITFVPEEAAQFHALAPDSDVAYSTDGSDIFARAGLDPELDELTGGYTPPPAPPTHKEWLQEVYWKLLEAEWDMEIAKGTF